MSAPKKPAARKTAKKKPTARKRSVNPDHNPAECPACQRLAAGRSLSPYKDEYAQTARLMCENGATDAELADAFDVSTSTIRNWQSAHKAFGNALKIGKGEFDDRVERALAQRAVGYSYDTEKIFMPPGSTEETRVVYREHIPPDPGAAMKWLAARRKKEWGGGLDNLTGPDGGPLVGIIALLKEVNGGTASLVQPGTEGTSAPLFGSHVEAEQPLLDNRQERQEGEI